MRKDKNELLRLQTLIESDRLLTGDNFGEMLINDITKLLRDYFDFSMTPNLAIEKSRDGYFVNFSINASRLKSFANIQK